LARGYLGNFITYTGKKCILTLLSSVVTYTCIHGRHSSTAIEHRLRPAVSTPRTNCCYWVQYWQHCTSPYSDWK